MQLFRSFDKIYNILPKNIKTIKESKTLPQTNVKGNQEVDIFLALYLRSLIIFDHLNDKLEKKTNVMHILK